MPRNGLHIGGGDLGTDERLGFVDLKVVVNRLLVDGAKRDMVEVRTRSRME